MSVRWMEHVGEKQFGEVLQASILIQEQIDAVSDNVRSWRIEDDGTWTVKFAPAANAAERRAVYQTLWLLQVKPERIRDDEQAK